MSENPTQTPDLLSSDPDQPSTLPAGSSFRRYRGLLIGGATVLALGIGAGGVGVGYALAGQPSSTASQSSGPGGGQGSGPGAAPNGNGGRHGTFTGPGTASVNAT